MAESKRGMSQNETLMHRAVSVAVAVALAGSMANFGVAAQAYAEEAANTNGNAENAALMAENTNEVSEAALLDVDKTTLQKNLSAAESALAKKSLYTSASWTAAALETAIDNGNKVNENASATEDEVSAAATALQTAMDKLVVEKTVADAISAFKTRFAKTGDDKSRSVTTNTDYAAYAFYHIDKGATIDTDTLATNFKADSKATTDIAELSRWILTLTGAGLDASKLSTSTFGDGNSDLIATLESLIKAKTVDNMKVEELVWALPVYQNYSDSNGYADKMVTKLVTLQTDDTDNNMFGATDYATVARAILALAPYCDEEGTVYDEGDYVEKAETAVKSALTALKKGQNSADGGFIEGIAASSGTAPLATAESSVETTSQVVAALVAAGVDPEGTDYTTTDGNTPVTYLLAKADDDYKYSTYQATPADEPGVAAMVFEALEADQQYTANKKAFDVLEFPVTATKTTTSTNTNKTTTTTTTAKTGDNGLLLGAAGVIAAAAAGTVVFSRRRENNNK